MIRKKKILYVDDEKINVQLFQINFSNSFEVLISCSGMDGLLLLDKNLDTEVVISDMKMPEMNGLEFIGKAKGKYPNKRYYILTGFDITGEIQHALDNKLILKCLKKPFNLQEIERILNE
ncbi:MAG: response regulator [Bacteroidales bacterium]|nr:response regulator [Bacteroidales bacterium]